MTERGLTRSELQELVVELGALPQIVASLEATQRAQGEDIRQTRESQIRTEGVTTAMKERLDRINGQVTCAVSDVARLQTWQKVTWAIVFLIVAGAIGLMFK